MVDVDIEYMVLIVVFSELIFFDVFDLVDELGGIVVCVCFDFDGCMLWIVLNGQVDVYILLSYDYIVIDIVLCGVDVLVDIIFLCEQVEIEVVAEVE